MKIYDETKTQELKPDEIDYEHGKLVTDKIIKLHHDAVSEVPAKTVAEQVAELAKQGVKVKEINGKQYRVTFTYDNGGEDVAEIADLPAEPAKDAYDEYEDIQVYVPLTAEELKERADRKRHAELKSELSKIKEDIEQETFGLVRDDFEVKKARAAEIINELRVLEGKQPRDIKE